ncbi:conserved hypothetical protein [Wolbachia endosymbiont of Drosophila simulans]|nr:conserved hypothetical protein [Wolbachia endosymbiont of Drosophila simulans]
MVLGAAFSPLIVLATLIALVAIGTRYVGIGIGRAGEKIKEGAIETGKAVKSSYKDLIDKLPTVQARENNFSRLRTNVLETIANISLKDNKNVDTKKGFDDGKKILEMLQNEGQRSAIQELVKNGTIQNFSKDDMSRLLEKGLSTHVADMKALNDLINKFQPVIMAIGSDIKEVEQKVNEKAQEMKPNSHLGISSAARVSEGGITGPS